MPARSSPDIPPYPLISVAVTLVPTRADVVLTLMLGSGVTVNVNGADTPPPGAGVATVTSAVPSAARSLAGIVAFNCVPLTNVVVRFAPFQRTTDVRHETAPIDRQRERRRARRDARRRQRGQNRYRTGRSDDGHRWAGGRARVAVVQEQPELVRARARRHVHRPRPRRHAVADIDPLHVAAVG